MNDILDIHQKLMKNNKMFEFIKKMFIGLLSTLTIAGLGASLTSDHHIARIVKVFYCNYKGRIKCVSLNNRPCQARLTLFNINSNENVSINSSVQTVYITYLLSM